MNFNSMGIEFGRVPRVLVAFPLWIARDSIWHKNCFVRRTPDSFIKRVLVMLIKYEKSSAHGTTFSKTFLLIFQHSSHPTLTSDLTLKQSTWFYRVGFHHHDLDQLVPSMKLCWHWGWCKLNDSIESIFAWCFLLLWVHLKPWWPFSLTIALHKQRDVTSQT